VSYGGKERDKTGSGKGAHYHSLRGEIQSKGKNSPLSALTEAKKKGLENVRVALRVRPARDGDGGNGGAGGCRNTDEIERFRSPKSRNWAYAKERRRKGSDLRIPEKRKMKKRASNP